MNDKEQLKKLESEYSKLRNDMNELRDLITSLNFEEAVPNGHERYLMKEKLEAMERYSANLVNRIRFYRAQTMVEPWNMDNTPHCGQDANKNEEACARHEICFDDDDMQPSESLRDLLGMEVVAVGGDKRKCEGCPFDEYEAPCVKVDLVGGEYICLMKPQHKEEETVGNVFKQIRKHADDFMDFIDDVIGEK